MSTTPITYLKGFSADPSGNIYLDDQIVEPTLGEEGYLWIWIDPKIYPPDDVASYLHTTFVYLDESQQPGWLGWYRRCDLVASVLLPYPEGDPNEPKDGWVLDHIDSNKENDAIENLEWVEWTNLDHDKTWEFIKKAWEKHGKGKYGYRNVWYIKSADKVIIECFLHGKFDQRVSGHLRGAGCSNCGVVKSANSKIKSVEDFISKCAEIHNGYYDYSKVKRTLRHEKTIIICPTHGEFLCSPTNHLRGRGCPKCIGRYKTTDEFITQANNIHKNKYDYSKVDYKRADQKIQIICKLHGSFWQIPSSHLAGCGCMQCGTINMKEKQRKTWEQFIIDAKRIHGDLYEYGSDYINATTEISIKCKIHGYFSQTPNNHLGGQGCYKCGKKRVADLQRKTLEEFIKDAQVVHGNKYNYSKVIYVNCKEKIIIDCDTHGEFIQSPKEHIKGQGCPKCIGKYKTPEEYIFESLKVHGDVYDYSRTVYEKRDKKVIIICKVHGEFLQRPYVHLRGDGCAKCGGCTKKTLSEFVKEANERHNYIYDYSKTIYKNIKENVTITCNIHGDFVISGDNHLHKGQGCPKCSRSGYSKVAMRWLTLIANHKDHTIQHAESPEGEKRISTYKVDGYLELEERRISTNASPMVFVHPPKKIVFEFQGCYWHGCPKCFPNRDEKHPTNHNKTMQQLYDQTLAKNQYLRDEGYIVIEIWECDYYETIGPGCTVEEIEMYMTSLKI